MLVHDVEQGTDEWHALRAGRPTSSEFSSLVTGEGKVSTSMKKYASKLSAQKFLASHDSKMTDGFNGNWATNRGHELEPVARAEYEMAYQTPVVAVGFVTDDLMRYGASTDGFVGDDGVVEFKNLIGTTFYDAWIYWKRFGKTEPKYMPQVQGELFVTERKWCDLMLYNPDYPEPIIERIYPDKAYHKLLKAQLDAVIVERDRLFLIANGETNDQGKK